MPGVQWNTFSGKIKVPFGLPLDNRQSGPCFFHPAIWANDQVPAAERLGAVSQLPSIGSFLHFRHLHLLTF